MSSVAEALEEHYAEWSTVYNVLVDRSRQLLSSVLAKQVALAVKFGVKDSMATRSSSPDFGSGALVDQLDCEMMSAALGATVGTACT